MTYMHGIHADGERMLDQVQLYPQRRRILYLFTFKAERLYHIMGFEKSSGGKWIVIRKSIAQAIFAIKFVYLLPEDSPGSRSLGWC